MYTSVLHQTLISYVSSCTLICNEPFFPPQYLHPSKNATIMKMHLVQTLIPPKVHTGIPRDGHTEHTINYRFVILFLS
jgi:hypothetical protein